MQQRYAPGMRVEIRDAKWRIMRVDYSSDGGYVLTCEGLSELVQGREALFLTGIEKVRILDPRETALVDDTSSNFGASLLYIHLPLISPSSGVTFFTSGKNGLSLRAWRISRKHRAIQKIWHEAEYRGYKGHGSGMG